MCYEPEAFCTLDVMCLLVNNIQSGTYIQKHYCAEVDLYLDLFEYFTELNKKKKIYIYIYSFCQII